MSMNDPLGDMLTRLRNGQRARKATVALPASKLHAHVLDVLQSEGYIRGYKEEEVRPNIKQLQVELKYHDGAPVIREIARVSKPGRRVYTNVRDMPRERGGLGVLILSTPQGVMADHSARDANVGGEILCRVF